MISAKTGISKGTLSDWLSEMEFVPNNEVIERIGRARTASVLAQQQRKLKSLALAHSMAAKDIQAISKRDLLMLGLGVYIGEGSKTGGITRIVNSNPLIIKLTLKWFREVFGVTVKNFKVRIHLYPDNDIKKTLQYWSRQLNIPLKQFQKTQVDTRRGKKMFKRGKLPYGTAHVTVQSMGKPEHGVFLQRRINAWIEKVMK
jgi:arsenate reductase-like glutaredoxin family protein